MAGLLTVEDYNSVSLNPVNEYYMLDTSKISTGEFAGVLYDFCIVSHSINGSNHTFTFEVHNSLWSGKCYFRKHDGTIIYNRTNNPSFANDIITLTTTESSVKLYLYLCSFAESFSFYPNDLLILDDLSTIVFTKADEGKSRTIYSRYLSDESRHIAGTVTLNSGVNYIGGTLHEYVLCQLKKTDLIFDLTSDVVVGSVNHLSLNVDEDYLPAGDLVDDEPLDIIINYNGLEIPVLYDATVDDYCFDLDLTDKLDNNPVKLTVQVNDTDLVNNGVYEVSLNCNYPTANNFDDLLSQITVGAEIIELTGTVDLTSYNLILNNDLIINANGNMVNLNNNSIIINSEVTVKIKDAVINNGNVAFIQKTDSRLTINNCTFNNCIINDNYKGSVISSNNGETEVYNSVFNNCHHSIYHNNLLTVNNCTVTFDEWSENIDADYSAFLTCYDGTVEISNNVFDINYDTDTLCSNQIDAKYSISLLSIGKDVIFNGSQGKDLNNNNSLPFFNTNYNNSSHVYCKYYYPELDECVILQPVTSKDLQSVCHNIIGIDWVYKNNAEIIKLSELEEV